MMKRIKIYIKPSIKIIKVETLTTLAASPGWDDTPMVSIVQELLCQSNIIRTLVFGIGIIANFFRKNNSMKVKI